MKYIIKVYAGLDPAKSFSGTLTGEEVVERYPFFKSLIEEPEFHSATATIDFVQYVVVVEDTRPSTFTPIAAKAQTIGWWDEPFVGHRTEGYYKHPKSE